MKYYRHLRFKFIDKEGCKEQLNVVPVDLYVQSLPLSGQFTLGAADTLSDAIFIKKTKDFVWTTAPRSKQFMLVPLAIGQIEKMFPRCGLEKINNDSNNNY